MEQARGLLAFYADRAKREDNLTGPWKPPIRRAPKTPYKRRQRPKKSFAKEWALSILREAQGPVSASYIRQRLAEEYKPLTKQAVSYALRQLVNGRPCRAYCCAVRFSSALSLAPPRLVVRLRVQSHESRRDSKPDTKASQYRWRKDVVRLSTNGESKSLCGAINLRIIESNVTPRTQTGAVQLLKLDAEVAVCQVDELS